MVPKAEDLNKPESNPPSLDSKETGPKSADPKPVPQQSVDTAKTPSPSGQATPETAPESLTNSETAALATQSKDHPAIPNDAPIDYSSIQTTTQDINPDGYGVVVTDTGMTLGSVEVSTFRFSDEVAPTAESTKSKESTPSIDNPTSEVPKELDSERLENRDKGSGAIDSVADEFNLERSADEVLDTLPNRPPAETTIEPATANIKPATPKQAFQKPEQHSEDLAANPSIQPQRPAKETPRVLPPKKKPNRSHAAKQNNAAADETKNTDHITDSENKSAPKTKDNLHSDEAVPAGVATTEANELADQTEKAFQPRDQENLLPVTFSNDHKWFQEMIAFTKSSELMLRYLVVALLTGLGLSFVVGDWTFVAAIGYLVAIPGLFVLAVTGADITKQTISGCRMVEKWTSWNIKQILNQSLLVILSFVFAVIPGVVISIPLILSTSSYIPTSILGGLSCLLLFPMLVLSMIENKSNAQPFSATIFGSLKTQTKNWWNFFGISLLSAFLVAVFSFFTTFGGGFLVCFLATLGISMIALVYFRMLGLHYRGLILPSSQVRK